MLVAGTQKGLSNLTYDLVLKNGLLITSHECFVADVGIIGERIGAIGQVLSGAREIEARGLYVVPGAVDGHVHLTDPRYAPLYTPGADSFLVGTRAAAFGGVTSIVDFAAPKAGANLVEELDQRIREAEGQVVIDFTLNLTLRDCAPNRIHELPDIFGRGITSIKLFMAYEGYRLDDLTIFRAMEVVAAHHGLAIVHAENFSIIQELERRLSAEHAGQPRQHLAARPASAEGDAVHRAIALAQVSGAPLLLYHQTCEQGVNEIRLAKARGQVVFGEVCVAQLIYTSDDYLGSLERGFSLLTSPPIRERWHQEALWQGLADGTLDLVSTDHGPRLRQPGQPGFGLSGIEARFALVHHFGVQAGRISLSRWVDVCCTKPAEIFGLPRKGKLLPGYDADIVLFDPKQQVVFSHQTLNSAIDYCTYAGITVTGYPVMTISRGEVIVSDGEFVGKHGRGMFIPRGSWQNQ